MLDNDKLDDLYGNKFNDFELPVSDKLLANIKKELVLPKNKNKIVYWKWILSCLILSATITFAYFTFTNSNKKQTITQGDLTTHNISNNNVSDKNPETPSKVIAETNKNNSTKNTVNGISTQPVSLNETQSKQQGDILKNNDPSTISKNSVEGTKENKNASNKKSNSAETGNPADNLNRSKSISEKSSDKKNDLADNSTAAKKIVDENKKQSNVENKKNAEKNEYPISNKQSIGVNNKEDNNEQKTTSINNDNLIAEKPKSDSGINNASPLIPANNDNGNKAALENKTVTVSNDSLKQDSIAKSKSSLVKDSTLQKTNSEKTAEQKESASDKIAYFIGVNGGPSSSFRSLSGNDPTISSRNDVEKKILTYSAGIDLGAIIKNKIILNIGIGIDTKGEKYSFEGLSPKYDTSETYEWDSIAMHLDTIPVYEETQKGIPSRSAQNKYQFLRIPVMVGYCFTIKEKWFITPSVGININYLLNASSSWFDPAIRQYVSYKKSDNVFSSFSFAGRIKLDLGMNINDNWSFSIQPGYTRFLQSIYRKGDGKKLYPYSYDLNLGLRYTF